MLSRAVYRIEQLRRTLNPHVTRTEFDSARRMLGRGLFPLFESMAPADRRHCLDVFETLLGQGWSDTALLQAALIHDCGKGRIAGPRLAVWHRILFVLILPFAPVRRLAATLSGGMRALEGHDEKTLALAREYGAPPEVRELLKQMTGRSPGDQRLRALRAADDTS